MRLAVRTRRAALASVAAATLAGAGLVLAAPAGAAPTTETFEFTGGAQEFVVPADVCEVTVDAHGAQGGDGEWDDGSDADGPAPGGLGGRATATLAVTPGETLQVLVGGAGEEGNDDAPAAGGFNGGGSGGFSVPGDDDGGGGGGGASDVRQGGTGLDHRVLVAGGGGGGGGDGDFDGFSGGGGGGGLEGEPGQPSGSEVPTPGGGGGTQTAGGAGGTGTPPGESGEPGSLGQGGGGGGGDDDGGGGGGGGLFGGGGGAGDDNSEQDDGGGGGGGSGFGPAGVAFETGVNEGHGLVTITYDPEDGGCPEELEPAAPVPAEVRFTG